MNTFPVSRLHARRSKNRDWPDLRVHGVAHAARRYSLITPPSTFRRCAGASSGMTTDSS